jgi:hypothetical protein
MPYKDPAMQRARNKRYYQANKDKYSTDAKAYYQKNKEHIKAQVKARRLITRYSKYGLTEDTFNDLFRSQGSKCGICKSDTPVGKRGWFVDHCHTTGKTRGILCTRCNSLLGAVDDSQQRLLQLIGYLKGARSTHAIRRPGKA